MRLTSSRSSTSRTSWLNCLSIVPASWITPALPSARFMISSMLPMRRQRAAQLVGQRGQELVLAAVGLPQRLAGLTSHAGDLQMRADTRDAARAR